MKFLGQLILVILGVALTAVVTYWLTVNQSSVQSLEYTVEKSQGILSGVRQINQTAELRINNMSVKDFSIISFRIYNTTNRDFPEMKLKVVFNQSDTILSYTYVGSNGPLQIEDLRRVDVEQQAVYSVKITNANRDEETAILTGTFIIAGTTAPDFRLFVDGLSVNVKEVKKSEASTKVPVFVILVGSPIFLIILVGLFYSFYNARRASEASVRVYTEFINQETQRSDARMSALQQKLEQAMVENAKLTIELKRQERNRGQADQ